MAALIIHLLRAVIVSSHPSLFVVTIVCLAEIFSMTPFSMFVALQPQLQGAWRLSNTASGWISSAYFTGYMLAVPVLGSLTDRIDARRVWLAACALAGAGSLGFATLATDAWTAAAFQLVTGAGLAGTYMPGLKVITDRVAAIPPPRHVAFYTTSFTVGSSLSFWIIGQLDAALPWRTAVSLSAAGPLVGCALMYLALQPLPVPAREHAHPGAHIASVLRSADSMRYVIGYAAHVWELFALRAWLVPFVAFCQTLRDDASPVSFATLAALVSLVGVPASLAGAELSTRMQRCRLITGVMLASVGFALLVVPAARVSWTLVIASVCAYSALISADSAALTSGIIAVSPPASRGTAMAMYSTLGFAAASGGTFVVGFVLDALGGQSVMSWTAAFLVMTLPNVAGILAVRRVERTEMVNGKW
jgi:MFS family permease